MTEEQLLSELARLPQLLIDNGRFSKEQICRSLGVKDVGNWSRDIKSGKQFSDIKNLYNFYQLTKSDAVRQLLISAFDIECAKPEKPAKNTLTDIETENEFLKQELEDYKKLVSEMSVNLKKNIELITDFSFKKAFGK